MTSGFARDLVPDFSRTGYPLITKPYSSEALATRVRAALAARRPRVAPLPEATPASAPASSLADHPRRILLVEDEIVLRMSTTDMLAQMGCVVSGVGTGEQALELLATDGKFDLLLTDLGLPGMSGEELASQVRQQFPMLPVVIASGYGPSAPLLEGTQFISKPYSAIDLQQALDHAIRKAVA